MKHYIADEGKVFDWKEPRYEFNEETHEYVQIHLYAKELYIGRKGSIDDYIQVNMPN